MASETLDLDALAFQICSLDRGRRFSTLLVDDLISTWTASHKFIHTRIQTTKKPIFIPSFGYFSFSKKNGYTFQAAQTWARYGEFSHYVQKKIPDPTHLEVINFSQVAVALSVPRDTVELTFKEITLRIMQIVMQDTFTSITLNCSELGVLHIHTKPLRFKLKRTIIAVVLPQVVKPELPGIEKEIKQLSKECGIFVSKLETGRLGVDRVEECVERPKSIDSDVTDVSSSESIEWPRFVIRSLQTTHKHAHSGDRLWMNHACPLCRNQAMQYTDLHNQDKEACKASDKRSLERATEDAQALCFETEQLTLQKKDDALKIARYNKDCMELKTHYKIELPPIGDMFNSREKDPDRAGLAVVYKHDLADQSQNQQKKQAEIQAQYEDRIQSQVFQQRYQKEVESTMKKEYMTQLAQRDFLAYQVALKKRQDTKLPDVVLPNLFAKDESHIDTAKQTLEHANYIHQTHRATEKFESKAHEKTIEDSEYLRQLNHSQMMYKEDLDAAKKLRFETRRYLENYWTEQLEIHKQMNTNQYD